MNGVLEKELENHLGRSLFELVPFNVAVIDREFHVVAANTNFEEYFGEWRGRHCYEICKGTSERCSNCQAMAIFDDGQIRVSDESGVDRHGRACHYVVHLAPVKDADGRVQHVIQMTTDLTETRRWRREYDLFFERVPCYVSVIDRNLRIVRASVRRREGIATRFIRDGRNRVLTVRLLSPLKMGPTMSPSRSVSTRTVHLRTMLSRLLPFPGAGMTLPTSSRWRLTSLKSTTWKRS